MGNSLSAGTADMKKIDELEDEYVIVYDQCLSGHDFNNLNKAINLMAEKGWTCVGFSTAQRTAGLGTAFYAHALMRRSIK